MQHTLPTLTETREKGPDGSELSGQFNYRTQVNPVRNKNNLTAYEAEKVPVSVAGCNRYHPTLTGTRETRVRCQVSFNYRTQITGYNGKFIAPSNSFNR
ncbi:MAG: hypothetical protein WEA58_09755 [Balneolaceae bacterium]